MNWKKIKHFYKPNIITISLAFLCLGIILKLFVPVFTIIKIIPCNIINESGSEFGLCPINPDPVASQMDSVYFGFSFGDILYQLLYLIVVVFILPYTMSCGIFLLYYKYIKRIVK